MITISSVLVYCNRKLNELYCAYVGFCLPMPLITFFAYIYRFVHIVESEEARKLVAVSSPVGDT